MLELKENDPFVSFGNVHANYCIHRNLMMSNTHKRILWLFFSFDQNKKYRIGHPKIYWYYFFLPVFVGITNQCKHPPMKKNLYPLVYWIVWFCVVKEPPVNSCLWWFRTSRLPHWPTFFLNLWPTYKQLIITYLLIKIMNKKTTKKDRNAITNSSSHAREPFSLLFHCIIQLLNLPPIHLLSVEYWFFSIVLFYIVCLVPVLIYCVYLW